MKRLLGIISVISVMSLAGYALGAWLVHTDGQGASRIGSLQPPTVLGVALADIPPDLTPGSSGTMAVRATNPNSSALYLIGYQGGRLQNDLGNLCVSHITAPDAPSGSIRIGPFAPNATTLVLIPNAVHADQDLPSECQGQPIQIMFTDNTATPGATMFWST